MTEETENLVLEIMRGIQADLASMRREHGERLNRVDVRLAAIEQTLGSLYALSGSDRETLTGLTRRIERIERRLELTETPPEG